MREYILVVAPNQVLGDYDYERGAAQVANESVMAMYQEVYIYKRIRKHWRIAVDDTPKEKQ